MGISAKKIIIIIEQSKDSYSAYAENVAGVYGHGDTIDEAKSSAIKGLALLKKYNERLPLILKNDYEIIYQLVK